MLEVHVKKDDRPKFRSGLFSAALDVIDEAGGGAESLGRFQVDTRGPTAIITVTSDRVAQLLRDVLPQKGYKILN